MALQRRRCSYSIASRIRVPNDLRPHIGRREIVKSLKTTDSNAARLKGAQWEGTSLCCSPESGKNSVMMNREQIDALVSKYLDAEVHEVFESEAAVLRIMRSTGMTGSAQRR